jgi:hypothetical protein
MAPDRELLVSLFRCLRSTTLSKQLFALVEFVEEPHRMK